jgi:hypothetical protein
VTPPSAEPAVTGRKIWPENLGGIMIVENLFPPYQRADPMPHDDPCPLPPLSSLPELPAFTAPPADAPC